MVPLLIIDDVHEDLLLAERIFRQIGLVNPIELYRDAAEILSYFVRTPPEAEPVLIFIDLVMFPRNGLDVLRLIRTHSLAQESVSVVLTGLGDVRQIQQAYDAGATTFLIKPLSAQDVNQFLRAFKRHFVIQEVSGGRQLGWSGETPWRTARKARRDADAKIISGCHREPLPNSDASGAHSGNRPDTL